MTEHRKNMDKREIIYNGESVKIFGTEDPDKVLVCFTDNITAFNKIKRAVIADKGRMNCAIATMIYNILRDNGIDSHFIRRSSLTEQVCRRVANIPVEVIVRNVIAGSMAARLGLKEGLKPAAPIFDLCYKNEDLCDPIINDYHAIALGLLTEDELKEIYSQTKRINEILVPVFSNVGIELIDFKIEFGRLPQGDYSRGRDQSGQCTVLGPPDPRKTRQGPFPQGHGQGRGCVQDCLRTTCLPGI